ncbi:GNAT family N-acetyltransferase [Nocardiopsis sp. YSL2]|uniref:GNAT family N-acetyltransferase n=1 Tax=Nocardiopsis sp. YSL2 TaxID=2939492 RepID=UPI0026F45B26|nr:GNAT family N-acetyltransferase [Nocardiopsis sp. YSL2]
MRAEDEPDLVRVSLAADAVFAGAGVELPPDDPRTLLAHADRVLVATASDGRPCGLAATVAIDGHPHLEQIAVDPAHGRRGVGSALLAAVRAEAAARGHGRITLTTFRDLPWNGPWYTARGFAPLPRPEWGPELVRLWEAEAGIRVRPRIVMAGRPG